jgi:hypothetical protein
MFKIGLVFDFFGGLGALAVEAAFAVELRQ